MVHSLLSAVLIATQLLSWNASSLYLCMSADGSICIDAGPKGCTCCHEAAHDACCAEHETGHDHGRPENSSDDELDPCGCDHIQILEQQAATLLRVVVAPDSCQFIPLATVAGDAALGRCHPATGDAAHPPLSGLDVASAPLAHLASVVIQC